MWCSLGKEEGKVNKNLEIFEKGEEIWIKPWEKSKASTEIFL
jgi:antirestriction protein ArdC